VNFVKFITVKTSKGIVIIFGDENDEYHHKIAEKNGIDPEDKTRITGGGIAYKEIKLIAGESTWYGEYDQEVVQSLLPDWDVWESGIEPYDCDLKDYLSAKNPKNIENKPIGLTV
jgi:hypothetical protein